MCCHIIEVGFYIFSKSLWWFGVVHSLNIDTFLVKTLGSWWIFLRLKKVAWNWYGYVYFWLQQSIEINDDGIFMITTGHWIFPKYSSIHRKDAVLSKENIFFKFCVLSFQNCQDFNVWFMKLAAKKPPGTNQILTQSIASGWQRTKQSPVCNLGLDF